MTSLIDRYISDNPSKGVDRDQYIISFDTNICTNIFEYCMEDVNTGYSDYDTLKCNVMMNQCVKRMYKKQQEKIPGQ
jgi:hypothetical protein